MFDRRAGLYLLAQSPLEIVHRVAHSSFSGPAPANRNRPIIVFSLKQPVDGVWLAKKIDVCLPSSIVLAAAECACRHTTACFFPVIIAMLTKPGFDLSFSGEPNLSRHRNSSFRGVLAEDADGSFRTWYGKVLISRIWYLVSGFWLLGFILTVIPGVNPGFNQTRISASAAICPIGISLLCVAHHTAAADCAVALAAEYPRFLQLRQENGEVWAPRQNSKLRIADLFAVDTQCPSG
ncbi:hypothetical protein [Aliirhizobium smilacinae]|uniref:Uncharacterized protein n=1 Tax=Aliirhizobium smilacinae TaxID=1395944 RepID=A0A5C4XTG9_9HYPH|nr:hypothetical protein [Rhizobium smilacinae]TNM66473.1 hypothetical protein FHP24_09825 [Rhizobium smilacinae]